MQRNNNIFGWSLFKRHMEVSEHQHYHGEERETKQQNEWCIEFTYIEIKIIWNNVKMKSSGYHYIDILFAQINAYIIPESLQK